ncbi:syncoilin [Erpetoichthys calabaricus]|uniref:syncoilin n=1 Tax=Erpetoichthys calabaricus TaxID=27687 RepID=UPI002234DDD0|nr:syncoilin [Erpetoichthys calabaricus]
MMDSQESTENSDPIPQVHTMQELNSRFEKCIEDMEQMEAQRDRLVQELILLQEPMLQEIKGLHQQLTTIFAEKAKVEMECQSLREEIHLVKVHIFTTTRDCVQCQYILEKQRHDVAQLSITQEEMQEQVLSLSAECSQLKDSHKERVDQLRHRQDKSLASRRSLDLSDCHRISQEFESFLKDGRKILEECYEPRLGELLKLRHKTAEAMKITQEQTKILKERLRPLLHQVKDLSLKQKCLVERIRLIQQQREEDVSQYRETVDRLEEAIRELKTMVQLQKLKNEETETIKKNLSQELADYKCYTDAYRKLVKGKKS